jgi:prepilin-type processing-associated H-X9-DG protein
MLGRLAHRAFDARAESRNMLWTDGHAVWEGHLIGKHIGEFAGIPATGKDVCVPLCVVYDLAEDEIRRARMYLEMPVLRQQLGVDVPDGEDC